MRLRDAASLRAIALKPVVDLSGEFRRSTRMERSIQKVVRRMKLEEQPSDFAYWQTQSYQARLAALEQIRQE